MYDSIAVLRILMTSGILFFYRKLLKGPELTVNLPRAKTKQNKGYFHIAFEGRGRLYTGYFHRTSDRPAEKFERNLRLYGAVRY